MRYFVIGLVLLLLGGLVFLVAGRQATDVADAQCFDQEFSSPDSSSFMDSSLTDTCHRDLFASPALGAFTLAGGAVAAGSPIMFWLVLPIVGWVRHRGARGP